MNIVDDDHHEGLDDREGGVWQQEIVRKHDPCQPSGEGRIAHGRGDERRTVGKRPKENEVSAK